MVDLNGLRLLLDLDRLVLVLVVCYVHVVRCHLRRVTARGDVDLVVGRRRRHLGTVDLHDRHLDGVYVVSQAQVCPRRQERGYTIIQWYMRGWVGERPPTELLNLIRNPSTPLRCVNHQWRTNERASER